MKYKMRRRDAFLYTPSEEFARRKKQKNDSKINRITEIVYFIFIQFFVIKHGL